MNVMEFMEEGVLTTIIGMGVVFTVLIILSIFIKFLNSAVEAAQGKKTPESREVFQSTSKAPVEAAVSVADQVQQDQVLISPALVAAITASICALTGKNAEEFKFIEIRRVSNSRPMWSMASTAEIISTRQKFIERGNR